MAFLALPGHLSRALAEGDDPEGAPEADPELRDTENVSLPLDFRLPVPVGYGDAQDNSDLVRLVRKHCDAYFEQEVRPHIADAWIDYAKTKVGFEIPLARYFYKYVPPRHLADIEKDIRNLEEEILKLLREVAA